MKIILENEFRAPEREYLPEMRWWLAEGSHTPETLRASVRELHDAGFRAVELITRTDAVLDVKRWGWGSPAWDESCRIVLEEATRLGMGVSFTSGPNWYTAVPGITPDDNAAVQELCFDWRRLSAGERLVGPIPMTSKSELVTKHSLVKVISAHMVGDYGYDDGSVTMLDESSLTDITACCRADADSVTVDWQAPETGEWLVFVFWQQGTAQAATASTEPAYVVNHYTADGAKAVANFWDRTLLSEEIRELIRRNGRVEFFEDSIEIGTLRGSLLFWSDTMLEEYRELNGYDLGIYLPLMIREKQRYVTPLNGAIFTLSGNERKRDQIQNDLALTYSKLYERDYIGTLQTWLHERGMKYRAQAIYGQWQDQGLATRAVDRPELETLFFHDELDAYRLQTGTAHLYRKPLISLEMGAVFGRLYHVDVKEYLRMTNISFIAGMNRTVIHGYCSQPGPERNTAWPGYDGIEAGWSDRWGKRMPIWEHIHDLTGYMARAQKALRQGEAKLDIGIVAQCLWAPALVSPQKRDIHTFWENEPGLMEAGYSYDYITPGIMDDENVFPVKDGVLAPEGPGYRALVVWQSEISAEGADLLLHLAEQGLPLVLVDGAMSRCTGRESDGDERVLCAAAKLRAKKNVCGAESKAAVPSALQKLGVYPRARFARPAKLLTAYRQDADRDYLFLYNDTQETQQTELRLERRGVVYRVDLWNGTAEAVPFRDDGSISVSLKGEDSALYVLCDGAAEDVTAAVPSGAWTQLPITQWQLTVDAWHAGKGRRIEDGERSEVVYDTEKTAITLQLSELKTWDQLPEIGKEVSGTAHYNMCFILPESFAAARIDLGEYLGLASVEVNGQSAPTVNPVVPLLDITALCHSGKNELVIHYASLLGNAALAADSIQPGPVPANFRGNTYHGGAIDKVDVRSYGLTDVSLYYA